MDRGHIVGDEFDEELEAKRRRFEELLGNANGYVPVLTLYMVSPNLDVQRTEIIPGVKAMFYSSLLDFYVLLARTLENSHLLTVYTHALRYICSHPLYRLLSFVVSNRRIIKTDMKNERISTESDWHIYTQSPNRKGCMGLRASPSSICQKGDSSRLRNTAPGICRRLPEVWYIRDPRLVAINSKS